MVPIDWRWVDAHLKRMSPYGLLARCKVDLRIWKCSPEHELNVEYLLHAWGECQRRGRLDLWERAVEEVGGVREALPEMALAGK